MLTLLQERQGPLQAVVSLLVTSNLSCHPGTLLQVTHRPSLGGKPIPHLGLLVPGAGASLRKDGDTGCPGEAVYHPLQCLLLPSPQPCPSAYLSMNPLF